VHLSGWKASNQSFNVNKDRKLNISNTEPHKIDNKAVNMVLKHTFSYWAFKRSTSDINSKSSSWSWSYGSWIYKFLCNQCLLHTTKVVSSNPVHGEVYSIQHYVIKLVSNLWQVGGFLLVFRFPPQIKLTAKYHSSDWFIFLVSDWLIGRK
jgi:hypothetical protein